MDGQPKRWWWRNHPKWHCIQSICDPMIGGVAPPPEWINSVFKRINSKYLAFEYLVVKKIRERKKLIYCWLLVPLSKYLNRKWTSWSSSPLERFEWWMFLASELYCGCFTQQPKQLMSNEFHRSFLPHNKARISVWDAININVMGNIIEIECTKWYTTEFRVHQWRQQQQQLHRHCCRRRRRRCHPNTVWRIICVYSKVINVSMGSCLAY